MFKKLLIILLLASALTAQNKLDTLLKGIANLPDSAQIKQLNNFCWKYRNIDSKLAIQAAELSLKICDNIGDLKNKSKVLGYLSVIYRDQGEYEKSLELCNIGKELAISINDKEQIGYANNNIATIYRLMGNYPLALDYMYAALKNFDEINDKAGHGYCTYNIGLVYLRQKNYRKALQFFNETVKIREEIIDKDGKAKALGRIAEVKVELGEYNEALKIYKTIEIAYEELGDRKSIITVEMGIAKIYEATNNYNAALIERLNALKGSKEFNDVDGVITNSSMIGALYSRLGNFSKGKEFLDSAYALSQRVNSSFLKLISLKSLGEFYELQKDFKNAYLFTKKYNLLKDSVEEKENSSVVSEVEAAYQTNKKEREKELLQKDLELQKKLVTYWVIASIVFIVVAVVIIFLYYSIKRANGKLKELNALKDKFFTIIAHDLKNPFNVLIGYSDILTDKEWELSVKEREDFIEVIAKTSKRTYSLLENLLYWARSQTNRLSLSPNRINLKEALEDTIGLLATQAAQKGISLEVDIDDNSFALVDPDTLKLVTRNLLSNAVKFTHKDGTVLLKAERENSFWKICIEDNGVGINEENLKKLFGLDSVISAEGTGGEKGTGLGLLVCKEFIEKSGGKIWATSIIDKGTKFYFTIPVSE